MAKILVRILVEVDPPEGLEDMCDPIATDYTRSSKCKPTMAELGELLGDAIRATEGYLVGKPTDLVSNMLDCWDRVGTNGITIRSESDIAL